METNSEKRKKTVVLVLKIIAAIATAILGVIGAQSCTMSMSIFKNNNGGNQQTEQSTKVDSTQIYVKPIK